MSGADRAKFTELCKKPYKDQAIWFMNGFWEGASFDVWFGFVCFWSVCFGGVSEFGSFARNSVLNQCAMQRLKRMAN